MILNIKNTLSILIITIATSSYTQVEPGFDSNEAVDLIRICNSETFKDLFGSDDEIIPKDFKLIYASTPNVMDNMFQVYKKGKTGIIHFRGSTSHPNSWIENVYSAMIPAKGKMTIYNEERDYKFSERADAGVHSGFVLGVTMMVDEVISQIELLNSKDIYDIIITGHSQGGALAILTHAYLEYQKNEKIDERNTFKMYAFANPMVGNTEFVSEYNERFIENEMAYRIINPKDIVPSMPITYRDGSFISSEDVVSWITGEGEINYKELGVELIMRTFKNGITAYINKSNELIDKIITKQTGEIILPEYLDDIQYVSIGNLHKLEPFEYPTIIKDSIDIAPDAFKSFEKLDNGKFQRQEPSFYQHKPYNYYVAVLKMYSDTEYNSLRRKYLLENL
jgi:hypothetical protein